ncbi:MAG: hypothetical protein AAF658_12025 [Myxococcota bacterium]
MSDPSISKLAPAFSRAIESAQTFAAEIADAVTPESLSPALYGQFQSRLESLQKEDSAAAARFLEYLDGHPETLQRDAGFVGDRADAAVFDGLARGLNYSATLALFESYGER